jgi:hypothetical protein
MNNAEVRGGLCESKVTNASACACGESTSELRTMHGTALLSNSAHSERTSWRLEHFSHPRLLHKAQDLAEQRNPTVSSTTQGWPEWRIGTIRPTAYETGHSAASFRSYAVRHGRPCPYGNRPGSLQSVVFHEMEHVLYLYSAYSLKSSALCCAKRGVGRRVPSGAAVMPPPPHQPWIKAQTDSLCHEVGSVRRVTGCANGVPRRWPAGRVWRRSKPGSVDRSRSLTGV